MPSIEILHNPGCANAAATLPRVQALVESLGVEASVSMVDVAEHPEARERFAGSPTVLVDGKDVEPGVEPAPGAG